jgi:hypothetical protein
LATARETVLLSVPWALERALADAESRGNLGFAHVLAIAQHDRRAHPARQPVEGPLDRVGLSAAF